MSRTGEFWYHWITALLIKNRLNNSEVYNKCMKRIWLKQRKRENVWVTAELMKLCHEKYTL